MSQSATITRSNGTSVNVSVDTDDNNPKNISDGEAIAAFDAARIQGVSDADLKGGTMTIGSTSLPADRYAALLGGTSANASVAASTSQVPSDDFKLSRHQLMLGPVISYFGGNGGEMGYGLDLSYRFNAPVSEDGRSLVGAGAGLTYQLFDGKPSSIELTQADRETGATGRDFTGSSLIMPHVDLAYSRYLSSKFALGALARVGINWMPGDDVSRRLSGSGYNSAYCSPEGGGIFGDDVTGCENRPKGAFAQPGVSNDSTEKTSQTYFRAILGPTATYRFGDRVDMNGFVGVDHMSGSGPSRTGVTGGVNLSFGLDEPTPTAKASPAPAAIRPTPPPPPPPVKDKDKDGVPDDKDKCPDTKAGVKVDATGCPLVFEGSVTSVPESVIPGGKLPIGVKVASNSSVSVQFKDASGKMTNTKPARVDAGESVSEFDVPTSLVSGKYKLVITLKDPKTGVEKVEEKDIVIVERVTATLPGSFAPGQPPTVQDVKVAGQPKLEGVTYVIQAFDKSGAPVGELAVADKPGTIQETKGTRVPLKSPTGNKWKKEINYVVTLKNKEGHVLWTGSFEMGQAGGGAGGRRRL